MCGKFTQHASWAEVHAFSQPLVAKGDLTVSTPMRFASILRLNAAGEREVVQMRWGFAAKGDPTPSRPKHMHARAETIDKLPTFQRAFEHQRGILLVHTFNEGEELPKGRDAVFCEPLILLQKDPRPFSKGQLFEDELTFQVGKRTGNHA